MKLDVEFDRRPSVVAFHLRGFLPSPGLGKTGGFPPIRVLWRHHKIDSHHLAEFLALTGLPSKEGVPLLYPHVFAFPLQMVILTHPAFPFPIWRVLQTRNHLFQHCPIPMGEGLEAETCITDHRILEKGVEADLYTTIRSGDELLWESLNTFYYRGRFGPPGESSPLATAPSVNEPTLAEWDAASGHGRRFAALTGDYNGIHYWSWYARRFGFRGAFQHPQLVLGNCMARLPDLPTSGALRLDAWLKGPVYCGSHVSLKATPGPHDFAFAVHTGSDERPAILGKLSANAGAKPLIQKLLPVIQ